MKAFLKDKLFFNGPIRLYLIACLDLCLYGIGLFSTLAIYYEYMDDVKNKYISQSIVLVSMIVSMVLLQTKLIYSRASLTNMTSINTYGTLYKGLRPNTKSLFYPSVFFLRRLFVSAVLTYVPLFIIQLTLNQTFSFIIIFYLTEYNPFSDRNQGLVEIINEIWLVLSTDLLVLFTNHSPIHIRYKHGYMFLSLFLGGLLTNMFYLGNNMVKDCKKKAKICCQRSKKNQVVESETESIKTLNNGFTSQLEYKQKGRLAKLARKARELNLVMIAEESMDKEK